MLFLIDILIFLAAAGIFYTVLVFFNLNNLVVSDILLNTHTHTHTHTHLQQSRPTLSIAFFLLDKIQRYKIFSLKSLDAIRFLQTHCVFLNSNIILIIIYNMFERRNVF